VDWAAKGMTMAREFFGTDGIRGRANAYPMTPEVALKVGMAAGRYFIRGTHRHRVVIGRDTRLSGHMIESALVAGFTSVGMDAMLVGELPTPAIALLTKSLRADLGVMISASHNPFEDNGIKLFGPDGFKLSDEIELEIEERMRRDLHGGMTVDGLAAPGDLGASLNLEDAPGRYIEFIKSSFPRGLNLDGLTIVVDCANGAAHAVAPTVLWELGATVVPIGIEPDGLNINQGCGSTKTELMRAKVVEHGADLGIALDGDAARVLISDETGTLVDGDQLMAAITEFWHRDGLLKGGALVSTIMSNLGLEKFIEGLGLAMTRTKVGDRYVVEAMRRDGCNIGGEQSGHIILSDYGTTGDGLLAGIQILAQLARTRANGDARPASAVLHKFDAYPQFLKNVRYSKPVSLEEPEVIEAVRKGEAVFNGQGRIVLRKSGTEPLVRVMAEGQDSIQVEQVVDSIVDVVTALGT